MFMFSFIKPVRKKPCKPCNKRICFDYLDVLNAKRFPEPGNGMHDETTGCPKMWWPHTAASRHIDLLCWYTASKGTGVRAGCFLSLILWAGYRSPQAVSFSPVVLCSPAVPCAHGMTYPVADSSHTAVSWHEGTTRVVAIDGAFARTYYFPSIVRRWFYAGSGEQIWQKSASVDIFWIELHHFMIFFETLIRLTAKQSSTLRISKGWTTLECFPYGEKLQSYDTTESFFFKKYFLISCWYLIVCTCNSCRHSKSWRRAWPRRLISSNDETAGGYFRTLTLKHFGSALPRLSPWQRRMSLSYEC